MKEKFLSWQGTKRSELFLSCCGFDSYISFVGKKLLSAFGTVHHGAFRKFEYLGEIETKFENTLASLSGAQMGWNLES